jgi:hypothetical protein
MGTLYLLECQNCKTETSYNYGGGFAEAYHQNFEYLVLNILDSEQRNRLFRKLPEDEVQFIAYTRWGEESYSCSKCYRIDSDIKWEIGFKYDEEDEDAKEEDYVIHSDHQCSYCDISLTYFVAEQRDKKVIHPCASCGFGELEITSTIMWD